MDDNLMAQIFRPGEKSVERRLKANLQLRQHWSQTPAPELGNYEFLVGLH